MKKIVLLILSLLSGFHCYSQSCEQCKPRRVLFYDNDVKVKLLDSSAQGLQQYWKFYDIASGVRDFFSNLDKSKNCYTFLDGSFFTKNDTSKQEGIKFGVGHANLPPTGWVKWAYADYLVYGDVVNTGKSFVATEYIETSKTRELVKSASMTYEYSQDPFDAGRYLASKFTPLYALIIDFEQKKRDQGEPFAVNPRVEMTPEKTMIDVGESIAIEVKLLDCDDVPLKQREITFEAIGGTLDNTTMKTDDYGICILTFTADNQPVLAQISAVYPFQHATGYIDVAESHDLFIPVKKPNDSWLMYGTYTWDLIHTVETNSFNFDGRETRTHHQTIPFGAYVKIKINTNDLFEIENTPESFSCNGFYRWDYYLHDKSWGECWFSDNQEHQGYSVNSDDISNVSLSLSKQDYSFGVGLENVYGPYNKEGAYLTNYICCYPELNEKTKEDISGNGKEVFRFSVDTKFFKDTTCNYYSKEVSGNKTTTYNATQTQKYRFNNNTMTFSYKLGGTTKYETPGTISVTEIDKDERTLNLILTKEGEPNAVSELNSVSNLIQLNQNYPNPVNKQTIINYRLPERCHAVLKIYDLLGNEMKAPVNGIQEKGMHSVSLNATDFTNGIYYYKLEAGNYSQTRKMIVMK